MTEMLRSGSVMTRAAMGRAHTTAFGLSCFAFVAALATRFASEPPGSGKRAPRAYPRCLVLGGMLDERNRRDQTYRPCGAVVQSRVRLYVGSSPSARLEISRPA